MTTIRERIQLARAQELLTVEQAALLSQYNPQTIYRKAQRGQVPGMVRFGRGIRFQRSIFLGWATARVADLQAAFDAR